jgi:hypothetical protein
MDGGGRNGEIDFLAPKMIVRVTQVGSTNVSADHMRMIMAIEDVKTGYGSFAYFG